jgi:HAD superfamily hydrolase (TIGR01490 family)
LKKLAIFDFCETLVSFQTADAFIDFVRRMDGNFFMSSLNLIIIFLEKIRIIAVINKCLPDMSLEKRTKLLQLRGFNYETLNNLAKKYYLEIIKPNLIKEVMDELQELAEQNYELCIVSAGYSIYLKYFAEEHHVKHVISSEIGFNKSGTFCRGIILGKDCISTEKVNRIKIYFMDQDINYNESISYSDSKTDLPTLLLTGKGVVVSKTNSQQWCHQYKFKEIIWY